MDTKEEKIEYIIQAAQGYSALGVPPDEKLAGAVRWLWERYEAQKDVDSLKTAIMTIDAYMHLGFLYDLHYELFEHVLSEDGSAKIERFPTSQFSNRKIPVVKSAIRRAIGPWPRAVRKEESADWIAENIIERVKKKEEGFNFYRGRGGSMIIELVVMKDRSILLSASKNTGITIIYDLDGSEREKDI